jgi:hypothetical protein
VKKGVLATVGQTPDTLSGNVADALTPAINKLPIARMKSTPVNRVFMEIT